MKNFNLKNKVAIITGSAGFFGPQHAEALLEIGAKVILTDINKKNLLNTISKSKLKKYSREILIPLVMDVTSEISIKKVIHTLLKKNIIPDIIINNAAVDPKVNSNYLTLNGSRLENFSLDQWNHELFVGLTGAFLVSKIFGSTLVNSNKPGVILNIASDLSVIAPDQRLYQQDGLDFMHQPVKPVTYSVIKAGLVGLTKYLSTYWAASNIRCNALSPGGMYFNQSDDFVKKINKLIPMERMARYGEYKAAIQFLCSDASSYMTGQNIVIDGGRSVW